MAEYKCGDCFHAELCEKSEMLVGFSKDNYAYCSMFLNSADVTPVRHGRWIHEKAAGGFDLWRCSRCGAGITCNPEGIDLYCFYCGAKMDEEVSE